jgi:hypothetical protein
MSSPKVEMPLDVEYEITAIASDQSKTMRGEVPVGH